jgi:alpha-glucosidase (family GH31 glycosyl hydrolase)
MINFNMFGIPMVGADICGFIGDTTEELCARWIEVGAFYPFSRDHNTLGAAPQELYLWSSVTAASQFALGIRYKMLPHIYTLMHKANQLGDMVARALWMNFPSDTTALNINSQFMLGPGVMISPVLDQGSTNVYAYFPQGVWYSFVDYSKVDASNGGFYTNLYTPLTSTNVHLLGGVIIPTQQGGMTTTAARTTPFTLLVPLSKSGSASGDLFLDDGEQISLQTYTYVSYSATTSSVTGTVGTNTYSGTSSLVLNTIVVMGASSASSASLNGQALSASQISYDSSKGVLTFSDLNLPMGSSFSLNW